MRLHEIKDYFAAAYLIGVFYATEKIDTMRRALGDAFYPVIHPINSHISRRLARINAVREDEEAVTIDNFLR